MEHSTMIKGFVLITPEEYPKLWEVMDMISHDCGNQAGHTSYKLPLGSEKSEKIKDELGCQQAESALVYISDKELKDFSIGEESDMQKVANGSPLLKLLSQNLHDFFESYDMCGCCHASDQ